MELTRPGTLGGAAALVAVLFAGGCTVAPGGGVGSTVGASIPASTSAAARPTTKARDIGAILVPPPADVGSLFDAAPLNRDRCKTKVTRADLQAAWNAFFGLQERTELTIDELATRVRETVDALTEHRRTSGFVPLSWAEYGPLEQDALGDRRIPLRTYRDFAATYLARLGAKAIFSVSRPDGSSKLWQDILWNETKPVTEKRTGANHIARATILSSLQQLAVLPPEDLKGVRVAFVQIKAEAEGGRAEADQNLAVIDIGKGATTIDAAAVYRYDGQAAQVAAHEVAHLSSWRVCGLMGDSEGQFEDPVFTSFVPGFAFGPKIVETMTEPGIYHGYIGFERYSPEPVAVARAYGAKNPEEAQAVLLGELANNSRFLGQLYEPTQSDPTPIKAQTALWMARLHKDRPASYECYRLMADVARVRALVRARLTPLEATATGITENSEVIYTSTDPRLEPLKQQGMNRLKQLEDQATVALTGLPAFPISAINEPHR